jgi:hypothetical protein
VPTPAPALSAVATPSIGSPTTKTSGWPVPRRTVSPHLVPLSFGWDGEALLVATPRDSPADRNLAATRAVRLGLGHTRDVSMIEGEVEVLEIDALPQERVTGSSRTPASTRVRWPRRTGGSASSPRRIQAWREVNEMPGRELMRNGR